ncbi:DNA cytosine methyltransferase [Thiobacillus sp.]|uniref:DNA cytosine methyltransferase n=1 Tax=Thiobacillus sp. TaxID=924 RepID=UPI0025DDBA3C|nr:DNA cytosine methyltransferase [Thiobacillus sp.]
MSKLSFIDLFSGCGGLSLGLSLAGLQGVFAVERDPMAFETFSDNFLGQRRVPITKFAWPRWLEQRAWPIDDLLAKHRTELLQMRGGVDILGGGPPCQGFSFAGKRQESDPRNMLFQKYVQVVDAIRPKAIVLENVPGMQVAHRCKQGAKNECIRSNESFYDKLKTSLEAIGYQVDGRIVDASTFGVPQKRSRLVVIGLRTELAGRLPGSIDRAFKLLDETRLKLLRDMGFHEGVVSAGDAISDLLIEGKSRKACLDLFSAGFEEIIYPGPRTPYQKQMHKHCRDNEMDSMRLARHTKVVQERFRMILQECNRGVIMSKASRERFGLKKHRIHPMAANVPAPTITTLPDDVLHYEEPRILTVRESARLQSFPDWFRFKGKYTTGGPMRTKECPRYTQVGNAVPPFLGWAIGLAIKAALAEAGQTKQVEQPGIRNRIAA